MPVLFFLLTIVLNSAANILLKISAKKGLQLNGMNLLQIVKVNYLIILGLTCFALSAVAYFFSLRSFPISVAYPILVGAAFIIINIFAVFYFGEKVTWPQILGYLFLLTGMLLIFYFNANS